MMAGLAAEHGEKKTVMINVSLRKRHRFERAGASI